MRIAMFMKWDGATADQYEQLRKTVDWEGRPAKGGVFHVAAFGNGSMHVTDIWESEDDFNNFIQNRLMPEVIKLGITEQPQVEIFPLYAVAVPGLQRIG